MCGLERETAGKKKPREEQFVVKWRGGLRGDEAIEKKACVRNT